MKLTKRESERYRGLDIKGIDEWLAANGHSPEAVLGKDGLISQLTKAVVERALGGELTHHLGYAKGQGVEPKSGEGPPGEVEPESTKGKSTNHRNGFSKKRVLTEEGPLELAIPRDREGSFEPLLIRKGQRRFEGFDERIIAMYARGMTLREIQGFLLDQYQVEVSAEFISTVTDAVADEVREWQNRPLEQVYAVVFLDALRVKIRDEGTVKNKAVYVALGLRVDGRREVLGLWVEQNEGAKFWLKVLNELRNRGVEDILIAVVDGLKGFPEAIEAAYPETRVQTCIVHLTRFSLGFCSWRDRKAVANELRAIYRAETVEAALARLGEFEAGVYGQRYPMIGASWRRNWEQVIPFYAYPPAIRRMIYTTNAIESLNMQLRKVTKTRGHFPHDEAALKLLYLALVNITKKWTMPPHGWSEASQHFAIQFGERYYGSTHETNSAI